VKNQAFFILSETGFLLKKERNKYLNDLADAGSTGGDG
jgi:hypothetical protein